MLQGGPCSPAPLCDWISAWPPPSRPATPIGGGSRGAAPRLCPSPSHWPAHLLRPNPQGLEPGHFRPWSNGSAPGKGGGGARLVSCIAGSTENSVQASGSGPRDPRDSPVASRSGGNVSDPWPEALLVEILKELDEYYEKFKRETDSTLKRRLLNCIQRALIRSQELGDEKIQIVSQMVELVENRTRQVDSHVELFEAHQEVNDTTGHSGKAGQDKSKNETITQAEKPNNKRSRRQRNNENRENAANNHDHDDITSGTPKEKKAKASKKKKRSKAKAEREASPADLPIDPNEPTYCLCNQVSYGEMIGCDNDECPIEWFHFSCVGLNHKPKGKWYCPKCRGENEKTMDKALEKSKKERAYNR
ncbi:inhibitor of growth protein 1 isoform X1 [Saccopteryx bilineata]|uniref:inhibitor of growth protein 1 isoform X1 n=1 Tax=Saccopteryx bilineata TaxID=59482 RepID=UPI00338D56A9